MWISMAIIMCINVKWNELIIERKYSYYIIEICWRNIINVIINQWNEI